MSSSGLIYAVIVGAWAAYLVPMWLRRQDELNEARPTERFSTAIRLLSGKAAMERRYAKDAERREAEDFASGDSEEHAGQEDPAEPGDELADGNDHLDAETDESVDVRAFANPRTMIREAPAVPSAPASEAPAEPAAEPSARKKAERTKVQREKAQREKAQRAKAERTKAERTKRAKLLARRRRTTMVLFLAFSLGAVVAAVGGLAFLWAPAAPAALLSAYIMHLRARERRRFVFTMDRRRAEAAARQLRESRTRQTAVAPQAETAAEDDFVPAQTQAHLRTHAHLDATAGAGAGAAEASAEAARARPRPAPANPAHGPAPAADRRALVEQTDHAEWVDQERGRLREQPDGEGWDPVPVPLPTYVSAPVAPRTARSVDLDAPDAWSSARSSTAGAEPEPQAGPARPGAASAPPARERGRTPLFDQFEDPDRPRAANE